MSSTEQRAEGFFIVEGILSSEQCDEYAARLSGFASGDLAAQDGVWLQREPALERKGEHRPGGEDVRKVGGLYHDEEFRRLISTPAIADRMRDLVGSPLSLFRADALMKPPNVGSAKGAHQDSPYWPIAPMSLWSCWMPFDDTDTENGCMMAVPGSHEFGALAHVETQDDYVIESGQYDESAIVALPMKRGSGLFFHSLLVHQTSANTSGRPRRAITMSYMGGGHHDVSERPAEYPVVTP